jgi:NAD+ kinase
VKIGVVVHAGRERSVAVAGDAAKQLAGDGVEVVVAQDSEEFDVGMLRGIGTPRDAATFSDDLDLVLSFGGDGTFLRAAHLCRDADVPILGVNLGRLGFLAEIEVEDLDGALEVIRAGTYTIEERATLEVAVEDHQGRVIHRGWALNEVSIEKTVRQRLLSIEVFVDDTMLQRVAADALLVSTPTGSTAYALSAGGPIVSPRLAATLVVPVAPHSLFDRTVVAAPGEVVRVELSAGQPPGLVSCDGREPVEIQPGGRIRATGGGRPVRIARAGTPDFYRLVRDKFGLR